MNPLSPDLTAGLAEVFSQIGHTGLAVPALVFAALLCGAISATGGEAQAPNVLLIMTDDMNTDLGCYGHEVVQSPHLDALAARGVRFEHAYVQVPLCSPSRSSMLMGRRPEATGVLINEQPMRGKLRRAVTLPQLFRNNGYFTARVGKIYQDVMRGGGNTIDDPVSWDIAINARGVDSDLRMEHRFGNGIDWLDPDQPDKDFRDGRIATEAIHLLENHGEVPFFLAVGFYLPHVPNIAPKQYFSRYDLDDITLPNVPEDHLANIPEPAFENPERNYGLDEAALKAYMRAYYASISFVDAQVGRVLGALNRLNLDRNTIVVFVADHGFMLGEHAEWQKTKLFERALRVPFIIADPRNDHNGIPSPRVVEALDLYPTVVELSGLEREGPLDGTSLVPLLQDPGRSWEEVAYSTVSRGLFHRIVLEQDVDAFVGLSVRTQRYRYTEWDGGEKGAELYDYREDPDEFTNLAGSSEQEAVRNELRGLLEAYRREHPEPVDG